MIGPLEAGANGFTALAIFLAGRNSVHTWRTGIIGCARFALYVAFWINALASWMWWNKLVRDDR